MVFKQVKLLLVRKLAITITVFIDFIRQKAWVAIARLHCLQNRFVIEQQALTLLLLLTLGINLRVGGLVFYCHALDACRKVQHARR